MIALFTGYIDFILCIGSRVKIPHRDATVIIKRPMYATVFRLKMGRRGLLIDFCQNLSQDTSM